MRRWPSWTKTIPTITASAMNGIITMKTWSGLFHHAVIPCGNRETIEAKISSEIPLPIPRWVISSPIHISSVVAGGQRDHDHEQLAEGQRCRARSSPCWRPIVRNRKTKPIAWPAASATVR